MSPRLVTVGLLLCACAAEDVPSPAKLAPAAAALALPEPDCLSAEATALAFTSLSAGCSSQPRAISIFNRCDRALPLSVTSTAPFTLVGGPNVIAPRSSGLITVRVGASPRGRQRGTLTVRSLAQQLEVGLTADVQPPPLAEDQFQLEAPPNDLDVLLVLDDGATMAPIAEHVRAELSFFRLWLEASGRSGRFAVLNATLGGPRFATLTATPAGVPWLSFPGATASQFEQLTAFSFAGEHGASCTDAILSAIDSGELARFRRPGVPLQVMCLTNQADALERPFLPALARVETELRRDLPWPTAVKLDVIARLVEYDGECGATGSFDTGRYAALAGTTLHGQLDEVCDHWRVYQGVTHQGVAVKSLGLTRTPDFMRAPINVSLNGLDVPEGSGIWRYEAARNEVVVIVFEAGDVRVSYATACAN